MTPWLCQITVDTYHAITRTPYGTTKFHWRITAKTDANLYEDSHTTRCSTETYDTTTEAILAAVEDLYQNRSTI